MLKNVCFYLVVVFFLSLAGFVAVNEIYIIAQKKKEKKSIDTEWNEMRKYEISFSTMRLNFSPISKEIRALELRNNLLMLFVFCYIAKKNNV